MALSFEARRALGDTSNYVTSQNNNTSTTMTQLNNARARLSSVGVDTTKDKSDQNFLLKALDVISRPGYAADNLIREFSNPYAGSTPGKFDPLQAYWRGITSKDKTSGKEIMQDIGLNGDTGVFGGQAKIYNPSVAGAAGLALDIFNPLDLINWIGFGVGDDIVKGSAKGVKALEDAFGGGTATKIAEAIRGATKVADVGADAAKVADKVADTTKVADVLDDLGSDTVGGLIKQLMNKADQANITDQVSQLIKEGLEEKGLQATSKLDYKTMKPLQIGLQNPLTIGNSGAAIKLPTYSKTGAKLPIIYPGKDIAGTFRDVPGSEYLTYAISSIAKKIADTKVGQTLGRAFSTAFVPNTVPSAVVKKEMTTSNLDDLMNIAKTAPDSSPLTVEELQNLQKELSKIDLNTKFDYAEGFSSGELKAVNKGDYMSLNSLAKQVGIKDISVDDMSELLSNSPFEKSITELYDELRKLNPTGAEKELFTQAAKLRKVMDLMYDQVPEGLKPYFSGIVKPQNTDLYPSDITTHRLGMNVSTSPLMAYQFEYKGVPVSVVVNSGENFNSDAWAKVGSTLDALDELPETAIQALKGQIDVSPVPIKNPDTSMTIGDTIVLGRIDTPTVAHEYGHIWDSVAGNKEAYSKAILNDSAKIDNVITSDDLYSDYARSLFSSDSDIGIKEDLADSVSDYLKDRKSFAQSYPGRSQEIERMLSDSSISPQELAKLVGEQRARATKISSIPRTEVQVQKMMDSVDKYAQQISWEPGTKAYSAFRENFAKLFEETNWKTKQWQEQVGAMFQGLSEEERKQIMDAAAQITGSEVPKKSTVIKETTIPAFSKQEYPVFASKLQEAVTNMPNSMSVDQFQKYLDGKGIKKEEMKWTFMDDLLDGKDKVTKQEVQDWVAGNKLEVNEVWRTNNNLDFSSMRSVMEDNDLSGEDIKRYIQEYKDSGMPDSEITGQLTEAFDLGPNEADYILKHYEDPEVMYHDIINSEGDKTKFSKYTQPGGEGYTELIFTLPEDYYINKVKPQMVGSPSKDGLYTITSPTFGDDITAGTKEKMEERLKFLLSQRPIDQRLVDLGFYPKEQLGRVKFDDAKIVPMGGTNESKAIEANGPIFTAPYHWDSTSNPVAHTRFDTRYTEDGKKILFIDEIQSDWHQHGRDNGYYDPITNEPIDEYKFKDLDDDSADDAVADAPFKTNWDEYVQKRMLRYAADNGYDGIAWSTGKQQAERWSQSVTEGVDTLQYNQESHFLRSYKNGESVINQQVEPEQLESIVGKDVARQLLDESEDTFKVIPVEKVASEGYLTDRAIEATEGMDPVQMSRWLDRNQDMMEKGTSGFQVEDNRGNRWGYIYPDEKSAQKAIDDLTTVGERVKTVSGTNVTVGGEGMRKFYDQQIPSNFKKLGKKFGLSVDEVSLDFGTQQGMWLTPESRTKITQQSFPLYAGPSSPEAAHLTDGWSDRQVNALDNFLKWRNSVVKQYRQMGIPINELEKYVPFIPTRGLKTPEADTLRTVFGTGVKDATTDNFDTLMAELVKRDPNLKARTTNATRPSEVNAMLKKPWLTEDAAVAMSIRGSRAIKAKEFNDFADEFVRTYGLSMGDLGKSMVGSSIPDGYGAFKVGTDTNGSKVFQAINSIPATTDVGTDVIFLPKEMVNYYNEYSKVMFNTQARNGVLDLYDQLNRVYKKTAYLWNPGHIARDFEGNVFNNYLMGVKNPVDYVEGLKVVNNVEGSIKTPTKEYTYKEIHNMAKKMGIIDSEIAYEIPTLSGKSEGKYTKAMRKATYATDGWTRATGFVYNLKQGMSPAQAAAQTKKYLFDYMDLTSFERNVMRRIVPFYTWMRKNIPLQLEVLLKNPRIYSRINRMKDSIAGEPIDWSSKPDYIQDSGAIKPQGSNMYVGLSMPYQDLAKIPVGADMDALGNLLSSISPIIRAPIESITNQDWWTGKALESYSGEKSDIPVLTTLLEMLTGNQGPQVDARVTGNVLSNIPLLTRAGNLLDSATGKETSDVKNLSRLSSTIGGPSFYDASSVERSATYQEKQRLLDLIRLLEDQGLDIPTMAELTPNKTKSRGKPQAPKKSDMKGYDKVPHKS